TLVLLRQQLHVRVQLFAQIRLCAVPLHETLPHADDPRAHAHLSSTPAPAASQRPRVSTPPSLPRAGVGPPRSDDRTSLAAGSPIPPTPTPASPAPPDGAAPETASPAPPCTRRA